jgi:hypothetical protein
MVTVVVQRSGGGGYTGGLWADRGGRLSTSSASVGATDVGPAEEELRCSGARVGSFCRALSANRRKRRRSKEDRRMRSGKLSATLVGKRRRSGCGASVVPSAQHGLRKKEEQEEDRTG